MVEHLEAVWDLGLVASTEQLFDFLYPVLPEGLVGSLDCPQNGLRRVGALGFWEVDFLCFEEEALDFIGPGQQADLR